MNPLTLFGAAAVTLMLVSYALEQRSPWWVLVFAGACAASSLYGWLAGTWPFGVVEGVWALVALRRWWLQRARQHRSDAAPRRSRRSGRGLDKDAPAREHLRWRWAGGYERAAVANAPRFGSRARTASAATMRWVSVTTAASRISVVLASFV